MNPYPSSFPKVRGGFSPFPVGSPQGVAGLGDVTSVIPNNISTGPIVNGISNPSGLCTDASCLMTGTTNIDPITGQPIDVELSSGLGIPTIYLVYGVIALFALSLISER